jgi:hypothetical protein
MTLDEAIKRAEEVMVETLPEPYNAESEGT